VRDELEAYRVLVKREKEIGFPVTYDLVLEAMRLAEELKRERLGARAEATAQA